jgi:hypothetical protein
LKWGTAWEREKGMGRKGGEEVSTQATWDQGGRESHHDKNRGGISRQRGIIKGIIKGIGPCASDIMPNLYILCQLCVYRANKELCLGYK